MGFFSSIKKFFAQPTPEEPKETPPTHPQDESPSAKEIPSDREQQELKPIEAKETEGEASIDNALSESKQAQVFDAKPQESSVVTASDALAFENLESVQAEQTASDSTQAKTPPLSSESLEQAMEGDSAFLEETQAGADTAVPMAEKSLVREEDAFAQSSRDDRDEEEERPSADGGDEHRQREEHVPFEEASSETKSNKGGFFASFKRSFFTQEKPDRPEEKTIDEQKQEESGSIPEKEVVSAPEQEKAEEPAASHIDGELSEALVSEEIGEALEKEAVPAPEQEKAEEPAASQIEDVPSEELVSEEIEEPLEKEVVPAPEQEKAEGPAAPHIDGEPSEALVSEEIEEPLEKEAVPAPEQEKAEEPAASHIEGDSSEEIGEALEKDAVLAPEQEKAEEPAADHIDGEPFEEAKDGAHEGATQIAEDAQIAEASKEEKSGKETSEESDFFASLKKFFVKPKRELSEEKSIDSLGEETRQESDKEPLIDEKTLSEAKDQEAEPVISQAQEPLPEEHAEQVKESGDIETSAKDQEAEAVLLAQGKETGAEDDHAKSLDLPKESEEMAGQAEISAKDQEAEPVISQAQEPLPEEHAEKLDEQVKESEEMVGQAETSAKDQEAEAEVSQGKETVVAEAATFAGLPHDQAAEKGEKKKTGFFASIRRFFGGKEPEHKEQDERGGEKPSFDSAGMIVALREAEPKLSVWLGIVLEGIDEANEAFYDRLRFLLRSLEAPTDEVEQFVSEFKTWVESMEYAYVEEFRSELLYRLTLALGLEDEEDERNRLFLKIRQGLAKTREHFSKNLDRLLASHGNIDEEFWEDVEELFIKADLGFEATMQLVERLRKSVREQGITESSEIPRLLREILEDIFKIPPHITAYTPPEVVLMVGVNGVGKTTTIGKLANRERLRGRKVMICAADTFRAAAIEQLEVWAKRAGALFYAKQTGSDPAAVAYEAMDMAMKNGVDLLFIDTAGRLQTKRNLMDELQKIRNVVQKKHPGSPHRTVLVIDATTGQNALSQVKRFRESSGVDELIVTKLDGTAKGGFVIALALEHHLPISFIGLGEKLEDLRPFNGQDFADSLLEKQG